MQSDASSSEHTEDGINRLLQSTLDLEKVTSFQQKRRRVCCLELPPRGSEGNHPSLHTEHVQKKHQVFAGAINTAKRRSYSLKWIIDRFTSKAENCPVIGWVATLVAILF